MALTAFSFGYEGWGPHTPEMIQAFDAVERARGFAPPLLVDVRIRREVRAPGFQGNALGKLLGDRYRWMPKLGNLAIVSEAFEMLIAEPEAARDLLDLILKAATENRRVVFFCSCGEIHGCHRELVASFLLMEASRRQVNLTVVEWPGDEPRRFELPVSAEILSKVAKGRKSVPLPDDDPRWFGTPWHSVAVLKAGDRTLEVVTGPARPSHGWTLPVLPMDSDHELRHQQMELTESYRMLTGVAPRHAQSQGEQPVHPSCVYHIRHSETLAEIAAQPGGAGELIERGDWLAVFKLFQEAARRQERLLMLFDNAEEFVGVNWVAEIDYVTFVEDEDGVAETHLRISQLRQLPREQWLSRSDLRLMRTGKPLNEGYRRGKVLCHTPEFLMPPSIRLQPISRPMRNGIARVYAGDFSAMPERISFQDFMDLHAAIAGYDLAEQFGYGKPADLAHRKRREYEATGRWSGTARELWLCVFFEGRAAHWDTAPSDREWRSLYEALRQALQQLSPDEPRFDQAHRQAW